MPSGRDLEKLGKDIVEHAKAQRDLIAEQFKGMGPNTHRMSDEQYPFWWEMQVRNALKEQLADPEYDQLPVEEQAKWLRGITGWEWADGITTLQAWDRVLSSGMVEGGTDEVRRYLRTKAKQAGMMEAGNVVSTG